MKSKKVPKITNDLLFQCLFGKVGNERITKGFLEKVLGIEIEDLTLDTNKRLISKLVKNKVGRIDVKAKLKDGTKVIIEMQVAGYKYIAERLLYYWAHNYAGDLKRGELYPDLKKTIAILISVENLVQTKQIEKYHTEWKIREKEYTDVVLTDDLQIHVIELSKFKEGQEERPEDNWIRFIKAKEVSELEELSRKDKIIKEATEKLAEITADPDMARLYEAIEMDLRDKLSELKAERDEGIEEGVKEGRKEGIKEGIEKGIAKANRENIITMYKENVKIEDISRFLKISQEEIKKILKEEGLADNT